MAILAGQDISNYSTDQLLKFLSVGKLGQAEQITAELRSRGASEESINTAMNSYIAQHTEKGASFGWAGKEMQGLNTWSSEHMPELTAAALLAIGGVGAGWWGAGAEGAGATAAGGGLTAEAAGSTTALSGEAGAGLGLSAETLGGAGTAAGSTAGATTMPLNTVEGYTAGTGAGTNTTATGFDWGQWAESLNNPQSLLAIGSGISGIVQGNQQQDQAALAAQAANPWGTSGGYALAGQQLQSLMKDPMQVAATDPSYQLRIQGAQRAMGAYGQDSGAMSIAGANASTDWYNQRLEQLGRLAGAGLNPAQAGQIGMQGLQNANDTTSTGLGRIAYGFAAAPTAQTLPQG